MSSLIGARLCNSLPRELVPLLLIPHFLPLPKFEVQYCKLTLHEPSILNIKNLTTTSLHSAYLRIGHLAKGSNHELILTRSP